MKRAWMWLPMLTVVLAALVVMGCAGSSADDTTDGDGPGDGDTQDGDEPEDGDEDGDVPDDGDDEDGDVPDDGDEEDGDEPDGDEWEGTKCDIDRHSNDRVVTRAGGTVQICIEGDPLDGTAIRIPKDKLVYDVNVVIRQVEDLVVEGWVPVGPAVQFKATPVNEGESVKLEWDAGISIPYVVSRMPEGARNFHIQIVSQLDPEIGITSGENNPPYFLPKTRGLLRVDRPRQLMHFDNNHFATYQAMVPAQILPPTQRRFTYRAIAGISMGAGGAASIGFKNPDQFDLIGPMGGLMDMGYLIANMYRTYLGGFCSREEILADPDPAAVDAFVTDTEAECGWYGPQTDPENWSTLQYKWYMVEPRACYPDEHAQGYNHWYYDDNGGSFDRSEYLKLFRDLTYSYGNSSNYNPDSPYFAAGLTGDRLDYYFANIYPLEEAASCNALAQWMLDDPLKNFFDAEYNPEGEYPVIYYCDMGRINTGDFDPDHPQARSRRFDLGLAVDYNGNGIRDYGEPIIRQFWEPWRDCGTDGLCDEDEPGYHPVNNPDPNGDNYCPYNNPTGTEGNFVYDVGEPWQDYGIDGVVCPGCEDGCDAPTCNPAQDCPFDYGECNGVFDYNPNVVRYFENDPVQLVRAMDIDTLKRLNVWMDAGIRDIFNFVVMADNLSAALQTRLAPEGLKGSVVNSFPALMVPRPNRLGDFRFLKVNYTNLGVTSLLRYGNYEASDLDVRNGDGRHVGYPTEVVFRVQTFFAYANAIFPNGDFTPAQNWSTTDTLLKETFYSNALRREQKYSIALPPGYFDANTGTPGQPHTCVNRYPVIYLMHGYGQKPEDLAAAMPIIQVYMSEGRFQKMIIVFPDGKCDTPDLCKDDCRKGCPAGPTRQECIDQCYASKDCDNVHRECEKGNFYANHVATYDNPTGAATEDGFVPAQIEDSLFDLIGFIDANYCTRAEEVVEVDGATLLGLY